MEAPPGTETPETEDRRLRWLVIPVFGPRHSAAHRPRTTREKWTSFMVATLFHGAIIFSLMCFILPGKPEGIPQISLSHVSVENTAESPAIRKPPTRSSPPRPREAFVVVESAFSATSLALPQTDQSSLPPLPAPLESPAFDPSWTKAPAAPPEPPVSFFGLSAETRRLVFAVDFSLSLQGERELLMRDELTRSLRALPPGVEYAVICFAGPAWYAGQMPGEPALIDGHMANVVSDRESRCLWREGWDAEWLPHPGHLPRSALYHLAPGEAGLPKGEFLRCSPENITRSIRAVRETPLVFGTDWRWPLTMAIDLKPDTIFFLTDGVFGTGPGVGREEMIDQILHHNQKTVGARIHTVSLMAPLALGELERLSKGSGGRHKLVEAAPGLVWAGRPPEP